MQVAEYLKGVCGTVVFTVTVIGRRRQMETVRNCTFVNICTKETSGTFNCGVYLRMLDTGLLCQSQKEDTPAGSF